MRKKVIPVIRVSAIRCRTRSTAARMRLSIIVLSLSIPAPVLLGQEVSVPLADFNRILKAGLAVNAELTSGSSYRFINTRTIPQPDLVTTTEVSRTGYVRTTARGNDRGSVHQAMIVGNSIFQSLGDGSWTVQTKDDYKAAEAARAAARTKAWAEKDMNSYRELSAKYNVATPAAVTNSMKLMGAAAWLGLANQAPVVTFLGEETVKGRALRAYRYSGTSPEMLRPGPHELRANITFWFDAKSGALVKTETRLDWIHDSKTSTNGWISEWELDPQIVIKPPEMEKPGQ